MLMLRMLVVYRLIGTKSLEITGRVRPSRVNLKWLSTDVLIRGRRCFFPGEKLNLVLVPDDPSGLIF